jgi:hypothetical protein
MYMNNSYITYMYNTLHYPSLPYTTLQYQHYPAIPKIPSLPYITDVTNITYMSRQWGSCPLGLGLVVKDKSTEFFMYTHDSCRFTLTVVS